MMTRTPSQPNRPKTVSLHRESGASLVEILVVMVVLLVGIFTIVRIFPAGFDVLQFSANETVAHRLARAEIEFWRKNAENLPEGIVAVLPGPPGYSRFDPTARPTDFASGTGAYGDYSTLRDDIRRMLGNNATENEIDRWVGQNRQRRILGEITRIPAPAPAESGTERFASIYTLAYAPIDWPDRNISDQNAADEYVQIRGNSLIPKDLTNVAQEELDEALRDLGPREYGYNLRDAVVYFPRSDRPRYFLASYTYRHAAEGLKTVRSDRLFVPITPTSPRGGQAIASRVFLGVKDPASPHNAGRNYQGIEPGTLDIAPKFRYLSPNQAFSNNAADPLSVYEYKVLAQYPLGARFTAGIAFNPRGYNQRENVAGGDEEPLTARIDYLVRDWRILRQDVTLPTGNAPYRTRVALGFLKEAGATTGDDTLEPWPGLGTPQQDISVIAIDTANGDMATDKEQLSVDYRTGTLAFPERLKVYRPDGSDQTIDPAGRSYRIFYSVEGDWAVVPQKAFAQYDVVNFRAAQSTNNFTLPIGTATIDPEIQPDETVRVLFPAADEGKAVNFNFTYRARNGTLKTVYGQEQQISSEARMTGGREWFYPKDPDNPKPYILVKLPSDADVSAIKSNVSQNFILSQVRGVSFRAVTVWRDRSRWRQEALTTHLTRASS